MADIAARRLDAQRLTGEPFSSPVDVVRWLGAVQSQDYPGARWALGLRAVGTMETDVDRLFDEGAILRTHVLRPTWHFVLPDDIRWMLELTGPRIRAGLGARYRQLEIDDEVAARASEAFVGALAGGRHLTRAELGEVLLAAGISPEGQRLPHLITRAELEGLVASGPRRGKQVTYALLDERAPKARRLDRSEALRELAARYFRSHGPAQLQDFVWWSGLTVAAARTGIELAGTCLGHEVVGGRDYWFDAAAGAPAGVGPAAHLLPNFDEYIVAYRDRKAAMHVDLPVEPVYILSNVVTLAGQVRGAWRRMAAGGGAVRVEVRPLRRLEPAEASAVEEAGRRLGRFLGCPVELAVV